MLGTLKKFFYNENKESIYIFEKNTKIDYDPAIFSSLKILSLTDSQLKYLKPLSVFINLEILNLSNNKIRDINYLKNLKKLKIIDLRFNKIERLPLWVFDLDIPIYWERINDEKEGIYLEGNPLSKKIISKIKVYQSKEIIVPLIVENNPLIFENEKKKSLILKKKEKKPLISIEPEQLTILNRQGVSIFKPKSFSSDFIELFTKQNKNTELKLNIFTVEYNDNHQILNQETLKDLEYIILILNETECCLNPPILELLSELYIKSKIFLIIENTNTDNIKNKITFFKTYTKAINIIDVYHSFNKESNESIKNEIYNYLSKTKEANSLWRQNWIELRDEIENTKQSTLNYESFQSLADKYSLDIEIRADIFAYLKKVGSIKED